MLDGAAWRAEQTVRVASITAWMTAGLSRQTELPTLAKLLGDEPARKAPQTIEEQILIVKMLQASLGGTLTVGESAPAPSRAAK